MTEGFPALEWLVNVMLRWLGFKDVEKRGRT